MGYGIPAALTAQLVHPDRAVVAFAGDGCFQMCGQELATMVAERLPVLVVVANNRMLGTIRMHQERRFPGRVMATDLVNPDFAGLARAYGAYGERVERAEELCRRAAARARSRRAGADRADHRSRRADPSASLSALAPASTSSGFISLDRGDASNSLPEQSPGLCSARRRCSTSWRWRLVQWWPCTPTPTNSSG